MRTGFTDLAELASYSDVHTADLKLIYVHTTFQNYAYRCVAGNSSKCLCAIPRMLLK